MGLNYKSFGTGRPVIILHGLFGMLDNWQTFAKLLATDNEVFIVDQRNHGRSFHHEEMNYEVLAEDLANFIETHSLEGSAVIGHSMGGKSAMQLAFSYPELVSRLVVIDIAPKSYPAFHTSIFNAILGMDVSKVQSRQEADDKLSVQIKDTRIRTFLLKNLQRSREGTFSWKANFPVLERNYALLIDEVGEFPSDVPALFVRGLQSNYIENEDLDLMQALFPQASFASVDAGHWLHAEKPAELLEIIRPFLHN